MQFYYLRMLTYGSIVFPYTARNDKDISEPCENDCSRSRASDSFRGLVWSSGAWTKPIIYM